MQQESKAQSNPAQIELADLSMIARLLDSSAAVRPPRARRPERSATQPKRVAARRCTCGKCRACAENARWERVFQEKFADPYYYSLHPPRQGSSLNGF